MRVRATTNTPAETGADTIAIGVFEGDDVAHDLEGAPLQALLESGEARRSFQHLALTHAEGKRWLIAGLGPREKFDAEHARCVAAVVHKRAQEFRARSLCWELPHKVDDGITQAFVEGTVLAAYRYDAHKSKAGDDADAGLEELVISAHHDVSETAERGRIVSEATNTARDHQNAPANDVTPARLAARAREIAGEFGMVCDVLGREQISAAGMGAFSAVAQGSDEEPQLITLRYSPEGAAGPVLGFVGKAVTFDSGGISIKPGGGMHEMKFDMSGGAAVLEATAAIARLELPVSLISVIGATENMPSGGAIKPGDIVKARNGTTIEIINTDAEGRLVLADCLTHAVEQGAERIVDIATLTGAITSAFGNVYAGVMSDDDDWCAAVTKAAAAAGEDVWRLPLHPTYAEAIKGRYGDIVNAVENRRASSIMGAEFLRRFTDNVPWAHIDIAGTAWNRERAYAPNGGAGMGVRTLVELARSVASGG